MPKLKKNPPTPFGMYLRQRRRELEQQRYVFPSGDKDILEVCHQEWKNLSKEQQEVYKQKAKEKKEELKHDLTQKFTSTGESYADLQLRQEEERKSREEFERLVDNLTINSSVPQSERNFVLIKTIHSCIDYNNQSYWPLELAVAAFNMKVGLQCQYWTLVNTRRGAPGYANDVKDNCTETGLPQPRTESGQSFQPGHSDFKKIITNVKKFTEKYLENYPRDFVLFVISEKEVKPAQGCLQWLYENAKQSISEDEIPNWEYFFDHLRFYPLPRLMLRFALIAKSISPEYENAMAKFADLHQAAEALLNQTVFNYRSDISCNHHILEEYCHKIDHCCQNVVLRSIYLILDHFVKPFKLERLDGHNIEKFAQRSSSAMARVARGPAVKAAPVPGSSCSTEAKAGADAVGESELLERVWTAAKSGLPTTTGGDRTPQTPSSSRILTSNRPMEPVFEDDYTPSSGFVIRAPVQSAPSASRPPPQASPETFRAGRGRGIAAAAHMIPLPRDDDGRAAVRLQSCSPSQVMKNLD